MHDATPSYPAKPIWALSWSERRAKARAEAGLPPRRSLIPFVLVAALAGGGGWWLGQSGLPGMAPEAAPETTPEVAPVPEEPAPVSRLQLNPDEVSTLAPQRLTEAVKVIGTLRPARSAALAAEVGGRVEAVTVQPGDRVVAGQVLVQVDVSRLTLELDLARSNMEASRVQLDLARAQLGRVEELVARGVSTTTALEEAQSNVDGLAASLSAQGDQVRVAELALERATVVAPFDGIVSERLTEPEAYVQAGSPLVTLVDLATVEIEAAAPVADGARLRAGQAVSVTVDGLPGRAFGGTVSRIAPVATEGSRTLPVFVTLDNAEGVLLGGMFATGLVVVEETSAALALPSEALRRDAEGDHVLALGPDDSLERRAITPGRVWDGGLTEVAGDIAEGDRIVTAALASLRPGDLVTLVDR